METGSRRKSAMNCVRWSMGDASLHGMGTSFVCPASVLGVTHVPGLNCYRCLRTVPVVRLPGWSSVVPADLLAGPVEQFSFRRLEDPLRPFRILPAHAALVDLHPGGSCLERQHLRGWHRKTRGHDRTPSPR